MGNRRVFSCIYLFIYTFCGTVTQQVVLLLYSTRVPGWILSSCCSLCFCACSPLVCGFPLGSQINRFNSIVFIRTLGARAHGKSFCSEHKMASLRRFHGNCLATTNMASETHAFAQTFSFNLLPNRKFTILEDTRILELLMKWWGNNITC